MARATWQGQVLAESEHTIIVEGNHYFPPESIRVEHFRPSALHSVCIWKGQASYYDIVVDGQTNESAAWFYPEPTQLAGRIKDYVAFWKGVQIEA